MAFSNNVRFTNWSTSKETVGTSSAALTAQPGIRAVKFKAAAGNAGIIYVGQKATATTSDWPLSAGEETDWLPVADGSEVAAIASQAGQELHVIGLS